MARRPVLYLLTGLPCSGKTTYARRLESTGVVRISVDDMLVSTVGRLGIDYDRSDHLTLLEPIVIAAYDQVAQHLDSGQGVVLDHGLGRRAERDDCKQFAESHGAAWHLLCFDAALTMLRARCQLRSRESGSVPITDEILDHLVATWERPSGEGEILIESG